MACLDDEVADGSGLTETEAATTVSQSTGEVRGSGRALRAGHISRSKMVSRIVWFLPWLCACGALPGFVPGHTCGVRHGPLRAAESSPAVCAAAGGASAEYCSFPARADGARIDAYWYRPQAARMDSDSAAVLVFTDVYGVRDDHNRAWIGAFAETSGLPVFAPDLFRGVPWNESKFGGDTSSPQYEAWRSEHYVPGRVLCDMADAAQFALSSLCAGKQKLAAVGFCFGGGRLLEAIAGDTSSSNRLWSRLAAAVAFYPTRLADTASVRTGLAASAVPILIVQGDLDPISPSSLASAVGCPRSASPIPADCLRASLLFEGRQHGFVHRECNSKNDDAATDAKLALDESVLWTLRFLRTMPDRGKPIL